MKRKLPLLCMCIALMACKKTENKVIKIVDDFLTQVNDQTKSVNKELITIDFGKLFDGKGYYTSKDWKLTAKPQDDSTFVVEAKGHTYNGLGQPREIMQAFALTNIYTEK